MVLVQQLMVTRPMTRRGAEGGVGGRGQLYCHAILVKAGCSELAGVHYTDPEIFMKRQGSTQVVLTAEA